MSYIANDKFLVYLMVDKKNNNVVFAILTPEFADLLSRIMAMLSTFEQLFHVKPMVDYINPRTPPNKDVYYMIMDNLEVKPLDWCLIDARVFLYRSDEFQSVKVGYQEALAMMKASFETKDVLRTVFLRKKAWYSNVKMVYFAFMFLILGLYLGFWQMKS